MNRYRAAIVGVVALMCLGAGACAGDEPGTGRPPGSPAATPTASPTAGETASPAATPGATASPQGDPRVVGQGSTSNGIAWRLVVQPGNPVCVQLRRADDVGDFLVCDENSEEDFNGDRRLRYRFGGLNPEQVPKFVIGITAPEVAKVRIDLAEGQSPEVQTVASLAAPGRRFFVVELNPDPPQEVQAVRGLDRQGRTVAGFRLGPPDEGPLPLPTG